MLCLVFSASAPLRLCAQTLTVFSAGSLARPFHELLDSFVVTHPSVTPAQENAGSLELARRITELDRVPDVIAVADVDVIPQVLVPKEAEWYAAFARNEMVLAYTPKSAGASEVSPANWYDVVTRPGVRMGASDPALDPNGYRTLMLFQLAERYYRSPGLAARLAASIAPRDLRPNEADLIALVQVGELDYAWSYRSIALTAGLKYVALPPEIDLGDATRGADYARVTVKVRGAAGKNSLTFRGAPILYALTIPRRAAHPEAARSFVEFIFSPVGRAILDRNGFRTLERPVAYGKAPAWLGNSIDQDIPR
ncbi:MAG: extracellular solute-binding protein [Gemmatimonadales bacterium]